MLAWGQINFENFKPFRRDSRLLANSTGNLTNRAPPTSEEKNYEKLNKIVEQSNIVLFKCSTFFPFDFFPDDVSVDLHSVNLVIRDFFWSERRHSVKIQDITDVMVETSPFFATLKIIDWGFTENSIRISFLKISDARKLRRIIQGLVIANREGVSLTNLKDEHLIEKVEAIGKIREID
jgi:hypothetical protein